MEMMEGAVAQLKQQGLSSERGLGVIEAEFLMRMAGERLTLFADSRGALRALELADAQLRALDDPVYTGVRQALAGEIEALRAVDLPDRVAVSGRLLRLATASPEWPLDARRSLGAESPNLLQPQASEQGWWARAKEVMSNIVVVHRENPDEMVLLTLEEERLLRENVQLQLQVAQLAAVRGEDGLYGSAIQLVRDWLQRYYDAESVNVSEALKSLDELAGLDLNPELPNISGALTRLRNLQAAAPMAEVTP
jgi:uncharacterized protein HemX